VQVDERVAPAGHPDRNLTHLRESLLEHAPLRPGQIHAMPVDAPDLEAAAARYARTLRENRRNAAGAGSGSPGPGPDGHTASLVPGDPVLKVADRDVAITGVYQGRRRMTLTYPMLNRSRNVLWVVTGAGKVPMLKRLPGRRRLHSGRRHPPGSGPDPGGPRRRGSRGPGMIERGRRHAQRDRHRRSLYNCDSMGRMPRNPMPSRFQNPV